MATIADISVVLKSMQNSEHFIVCVVLWLCCGLASIISCMYVFANIKHRSLRNTLVSSYALLCFNAILYEFMLARAMECTGNPVYLFLVINHSLLVIAMLMFISLCIKVVRHELVR